MQYPPPPAHYKNAASLAPPPVPTQEHIAVYGFPIHGGFETQMKENEAEWKTLVPVGKPSENIKSLQKLNMSLLFNFMELIDMLIKDPTSYATKVDDIRQIMSSMHHLINSFRPHQATAFAVEMLQVQVQRRRDLLKAINDSISNADLIIAKAIDKLHEKTTTVPSSSATSAAAAGAEVADVEMKDGPHALSNGPSADKKSASGHHLASFNFSNARSGMAKLHAKLLAMAGSVQSSAVPASADAMDTS